ncbi:HU family DNA-binding protein [Alloprevotella sp. Lung230]|uniref:HU family DNA-binding protein n=1 Tax=Alloprevotella sp. Lung230 TaxID=2766595 RepID=UPI00165580A0|nr:HU family DNA-binding protein [Alloprevotella sp. Lung230]MBC8625601.1 HU family DNA-binding protein [Alloprevotella sp. Lung230]
MIKYVIRSKKNPQKKDVVKYYPQMAPTTPLSLEQIIRRVEKRSTVSSADVKAVLDALQYEVMEALASGSTVRLGDLGSFRLTMKSEGAATAAEAKQKGAQLIKRVNVQFTKSTTMRDTLAVPLLDFGAQEDIVNATDKKKSSNDKTSGDVNHSYLR